MLKGSVVGILAFSLLGYLIWRPLGVVFFFVGIGLFVLALFGSFVKPKAPPQ